MTNHPGKTRILIVEDEPLISNLCVRILTNEGLEVSVASDGSTAKDMLDNNKYELCLIDIRTPVFGGKDLYHFIQNRHPDLVSSVIFTTGDVITLETQRFLKETGRLFLLKPFAPDALRGIIREALHSQEKIVNS